MSKVNKPIKHDPIFVRTGPQATAVTGLPPQTQYAMIQKGQLPKPIRISDRIQGWTMEQLKAHFARLAKEQGVDPCYGDGANGGA